MDTKKTIKRNSFIMASGTLASRLTGQGRTILLAAALGVTGVAANAYQVGGQIPHVIFNLIEGGLLNAVLVPQIVRAFKKKSPSETVNKILTLALFSCLAVTALVMICSPLLIDLYIDPGWSEAQKALANAFTLWCVPQILFYGAYSVVGQILASQDNFTAYAWSSVAANIVSCIGYGLFFAVFGNAEKQGVNFWNQGKIALTAGMWSLGVLVQALLLFIPLRKIGIKPRIKFGIKGIGLKSMGKVAAWTLASILIDQGVGVVNTRVETTAPLAAGNRLMTAGASAYAQAFQIWILPYSLITVSIATAVFPAISRAVQDRKNGEMREHLANCLRQTGVIMLFFVGCFIAMPVPIVRALLPTVNTFDANLLAAPLLALAFNLIPTSVTLLLNRVFYAYEDGRWPFLLTTFQNAVQMAVLFAGLHFISPSYWDMWIAASITISNIVLMPLSYWAISKRMGSRIRNQKIFSTYLRSFAAACVCTLAGTLLALGLSRGLRFSTSLQGHISWWQAVLTCLITACVMFIIYWLLCKAMNVKELSGIFGFLKRGEKKTEEQEGKPRIPRRVSSQIWYSQTLEASLAPRVVRSSRSRPVETFVSLENEGQIMIPSIGDTIDKRYTLITQYRSELGLSAWLANDHTLMKDDQLFIISASSKVKEVNRIASSLILSKDSHCTKVLHIQNTDGVLVIVTDKDPGTDLHSFIKGSGSIKPEVGYFIIHRVIDAAVSLKRQGIYHQALSSEVVRLNGRDVTLANTSISPMLEPPLPNFDQKEGGEEKCIRDIVALIFEMISGQVFDPTKDKREYVRLMDSLEGKAPSDMIEVCRRGLELTKSGQASYKRPLPILTFLELDMLLKEPDDGRALEEALKGGNFPNTPSVSLVKFAPINSASVTDIPSKIASSTFVKPVVSPEKKKEQINSPWTRRQLLSEPKESIEKIDPSRTQFFNNHSSSQTRVVANRSVKLVKEPQEVRRPSPTYLAKAPEQKKGGVTKKSIITCAIILVAFFCAWAIYSLHLGDLHLGTKESDITWNLNVNDAPIPGGLAEEKADSNVTGAFSNTSSSSAPTVKAASAVPAPAAALQSYTLQSLRTFSVPGETGLGIYIELASPQKVHEVEISTPQSGGKAEIYADSTETHPQNGASVASFSFVSGSNKIALSKVSLTQNLVVWISQIPTGGFEYNSVQVF
ncbi:MAG: murein biosynthesis integral membrane protein MurJ [Aeriscardovia sp.]|nr:murein biosynthesis integral membrane protein MurJ [Aeriscardovia sp.]